MLRLYVTCSQLTGLTSDLFYDPDELIVIILSTSNPPATQLVRNDESSGREYHLNFHMSMSAYSYVYTFVMIFIVLIMLFQHQTLTC